MPLRASGLRDHCPAREWRGLHGLWLSQRRTVDKNALPHKSRAHGERDGRPHAGATGWGGGLVLRAPARRLPRKHRNAGQAITPQLLRQTVAALRPRSLPERRTQERGTGSQHPASDHHSEASGSGRPLCHTAGRRGGDHVEEMRGGHARKITTVLGDMFPALLIGRMPEAGCLENGVLPACSRLRLRPGCERRGRSAAPVFVEGVGCAGTTWGRPRCGAREVVCHLHLRASGSDRVVKGRGRVAGCRTGPHVSVEGWLCPVGLGRQ